MTEEERLLEHYKISWHAILIGWLHWPDSRFECWLRAWRYRVTKLEEWQAWFSHEDELYYVLELLVPDDLALRLKYQRTHQIYNDFAHLVHVELRNAVTRDGVAGWRTDSFDWDAAKDRVERIIAGYGVSLPGPEIVTEYERWGLEEGQQEN